MNSDTGNPHIDPVMDRLDEHEKRIIILEKKHPCKQEKRFQRIEFDQGKLAEKQEEDVKGLSNKYNTIQGAFNAILDEVHNLRMDIALNEQKNSFQDQCIAEIKRSNIEKIRNKWVVIGIIVGALVGLLGPILIRLIEYFTFL